MPKSFNLKMSQKCLNLDEVVSVNHKIQTSNLGNFKHSELFMNEFDWSQVGAKQNVFFLKKFFTTTNDRGGMVIE